jgi:UDPglucose--hexose-1-phosphate uridylyltransferase
MCARPGKVQALRSRRWEEGAKWKIQLRVMPAPSLLGPTLPGYRRMDLENFERIPHRRLNPLTGDWVLVSPNRAQRPWQGHVENTTAPSAPSYDPACYLCPGNSRANGVRNPNYSSTFVFANDFATLESDIPHARIDEEARTLVVAETEAGTCKVVCFSPRHDLTLPGMSLEEIAAVIEIWTDEYAALGALPNINYVQIFENRGEMMGCSNPHPHCQIWANQTVPNQPRQEQDSQAAYRSRHGSCVLCDYFELERKDRARIVCENPSFLALVPFWAAWPFEILLISKRHVRDFVPFDRSERTDLADILRRVTTRYDNLFAIPFPYSMGFHPAPTDGEPHPEWHFHAHFYPLLRSRTLRKFMVGYEMLAAPQRDITPEVAASRLRESSEVRQDRS